MFGNDELSMFLFLVALSLSIVVLIVPKVRIVVAKGVRFLAIVGAVAGTCMVVFSLIAQLGGWRWDEDIVIVAFGIITVPYIALRALLEFGDRTLPLRARDR